MVPAKKKVKTCLNLVTNIMLIITQMCSFLFTRTKAENHTEGPYWKEVQYLDKIGTTLRCYPLYSLFPALLITILRQCQMKI